MYYRTTKTIRKNSFKLNLSIYLSSKIIQYLLGYVLISIYINNAWLGAELSSFLDYAITKIETHNYETTIRQASEFFSDGIQK